MKRLVLAALLAACGDRTQLMFGVATDLRAPDLIDTVQLDVIRVDNGFPEVQVIWDISGNLNQPFNLPGSYGVFSDGEEFQLDVQLTGFKNGEKLLERRALMTLVEDQTLFYRMGLTGGCIGRDDCPDGFTCVESVCRDLVVPSNQLPDFTDNLVTELTCNAGATYLQTGTGEPMDVSPDAGECPAGLCFEGTCLKPPPANQSGSRTVRGSKIETFVQPNNQLTDIPVDLSGLDIAAIVVNADGNATTFPGVGNADGTFAIQSVPNGNYLLKAGVNYTASFADNIDLGFLSLGRPDKKPVVDREATGFNINATGMTPWEDGNLLSAYAPEANAYFFFFDRDLAVPPAVNQTTLTNTFLDFEVTDNNVGLIDNDAFALIQYTNKNAGDVDNTKYQVATKILVPPPFKMIEGQLTQITGAFTNVPQTETVSFDVRQLDWERAVGWNGTNALLVNPSAVPVDFSVAGITGKLGGVNLDVFGQPGGNVYGQFSSTVDYLFITAPEGKDSTFSNLTYGLPHVSAHTFGRQLSAAIGYQVQYQLPGTAGPTTQFLNFGSIRAVNSDLIVVNPLLGPVRDAAINDRDIFTAQQNVPPTSRISWKAPSLGTASLYTVRFVKLGVNANNNRTAGTFAGSVTTTDTFITIPPGLIESNQPYYVLITASDAGNIDAPFRGRLPESFAQVASAIINFGAGDDTPNPEVDAGVGTDATTEPDAPLGFCDLLTQTGCAGNDKCTLIGGQAACRPMGSVPINTTCTGADNLDDCLGGSLCIFQTCRELCPTSGNPQGCAGNETCHLFGGGFNLCLQNCNALTQNCPATAAGAQGCYRTDFGNGSAPGAVCATSSSNIPVGQACTDLNGCVPGAACTDDLAGAAFCAPYCDFAMFPNVQGTCGAGKTCQEHLSGDNIGVCR